MYKAIFLSIKPEHALNILNGRKTLELRTRVPKDFVGWVYVYVTKDKKDILYKYKDEYYTQHYLTFTDSVEVLNSKVVARFWFDEYEEVLTQHHIDSEQIERILKQACIKHDDLDKYVGDKETIYAWHIKKLEIFDKPMELSEFYKANIPYVGSADIEYALNYYGKDKVRSILKYTVIRAPQSYQYVWVKE